MTRGADISLRIATPESIGSGFYLSEYDVICTQAHIVEGYDQIVIESSLITRQLARVIAIDALLDLAILKPQSALDLPHVEINDSIEEEDQIALCVHPFSLDIIDELGTILLNDFQYHDIHHYLHDLNVDHAANGAPIFDKEGTLIGMHSTVTYHGSKKGVILPSDNILQTLREFDHKSGLPSARCMNCKDWVTGEKIDNCVHCGENIGMPDSVRSIKVDGIQKTIESIITSMGYTLALTRIGADHWELIRGSAAISNTYFEKNGLIIGESYLCKLPPLDRRPGLFRFLLSQNHEMDQLMFSLKGDDIILSLLIYDRYLNEQTGTELLTNLMTNADRFDNILVQDFGCLWTRERKLI